MKKGPVLLVDDNEDDLFLAKRVFKKLNIVNNIETARNGKEALELILTRDKADQKYELIIMDLQLPVLNGKQVLRELKKENCYKTPVVIMSTSKEDRDVNECYDLLANSYIRKPVDSKEFLNIINEVVNYWFNVNRSAN
ncbi:MAG: response regulator [Candidatus Cyclobacteriaceae bacterium M2_1C_046]